MSAAEQSPRVAQQIARIVAAVRLPGHPDAKAKLERLLKTLARYAFKAGEDFTRRQWDQTAQAIPKSTRDAYAAGVHQGLEVIRTARTLEEARDRIMAQAVFIAEPNAAKADDRQQSPRG